MLNNKSAGEFNPLMKQLLTFPGRDLYLDSELEIREREFADSSRGLLSSDIGRNQRTLFCGWNDARTVLRLPGDV